MEPMNRPVEMKPIFTRLTDPAEIAEAKAFHEQIERNLKWLGAHWPDLLPQALGKFVAVAAEEAFVAESRAEARRLAALAHPDETGIVIQYAYPDARPRFYGFSWTEGNLQGRIEPPDDRG
jgi:hypothetical protein